MEKGEPLLGAHPVGVQGMLRTEGVPGAGVAVQNLISDSGTLVLGWAALHCQGRATPQRALKKLFRCLQQDK